MKKNEKNIEWDDSLDMTMEEFDQAISGSLVGDEVKPGDKVTGVVIAISESSVFVNINAKSEGIIALEEFVDENGDLAIKTGDTVTATVTQVGDELRLSHRMRKRDQTFDMLREAYAGRIAVEGRVETINKGGFEISLGDKRAFCPISQIDLDYVEDPNRFLGANYHFYITQLDPKGRNIVVSRSQYLHDERQNEARETLARIAPGQLTTGIVKRITDFGAFVDIGGVDGLVHISQLSWDRVAHPSELVELGQKVQVKILQISPENNRISLSMREAQQSPWDEFIGTEIVEGESYSGEVMRVEKFGAFVRLKPGLEGLIHLSEMRWGQRVNHPSDVLKAGDTVRVMVISIDKEKQRISLSLKQMEEDPWSQLETTLHEGSVLSATVSTVKPAGLEVAVSGGLSGFVPGSKAGLGQGENLRNAFQDNQSVTVRVIEANRDTRRLVFEIVDTVSEQQESDVKQYLKDAASDTKAGFGSLGSMLQKAMDKNKRKQ